jgi:uncharacterized LabA/DUF88 family protein
MPLKKSFLFIDGSNTYHGLKENGIYKTFTYKWLYEELSKKFDIKKVFFYDAMKSFRIEPAQYSEQQRFHEKLRKEIPILSLNTRKLRYPNIDKRIEQAREAAAFCDKCNPKVEMFLKEAGLRKLSKEKGVDVMLVVDMVRGAFQDKFETAILLTGDADFIPAVEFVQFLKKEVVNVHCYAGSSSDLRNNCDSHMLLTADANGNCFLQTY